MPHQKVNVNTLYIICRDASKSEKNGRIPGNSKQIQITEIQITKTRKDKVPGNLSPTRLVNRHYAGEIYFPLVPCETVIGFVYVDENRNGVYDEGEARPEGVLLKAKDKEVITGKDGKFVFRNLPTLWKQWIEVKKEQLYYKGNRENLKFQVL